jgi:hypothetical protein
MCDLAALSHRFSYAVVAPQAPITNSDEFVQRFRGYSATDPN